MAQRNDTVQLSVQVLLLAVWQATVNSIIHSTLTGC